MRVIRKKPAFFDKRGEITDILEGTEVDSVTVLTSKKGAVRGNHYHKKTTQYAYVVEGKFRLYTQKDAGKVQTKVIRKGDLIITPPKERHAFVALEDSVLLACCYGQRRGKQYEDDTYRLKEPIFLRRKSDE